MRAPAGPASADRSEGVRCPPLQECDGYLTFKAYPFRSVSHFCLRPAPGTTGTQEGPENNRGSRQEERGSGEAAATGRGAVQKHGEAARGLQVP